MEPSVSIHLSALSRCSFKEKGTSVLEINDLNYTISRNVEFSKSVETLTKTRESEGQQSPETGVKERTQKKRKEKPREGTSKNNMINQSIH